MAQHTNLTTIDYGGTVAEVTGIDGPSIAVTDIDITNLNMSDPWKKFAAGLADGGEIKVSMNMTHANVTAFYGAVGDDPSTCTITFPNSAGSWSGKAMLKSLSTSAALDDVIKAEAT